MSDTLHVPTKITSAAQRCKLPAEKYIGSMRKDLKFPIIIILYLLVCCQY
jgi:hypothetical protein